MKQVKQNSNQLHNTDIIKVQAEILFHELELFLSLSDGPREPISQELFDTLKFRGMSALSKEMLYFCAAGSTEDVLDMLTQMKDLNMARL